jgi:hypothetical protein
MPAQAANDGEPACRREPVRSCRSGVAIHLSGLPGDCPRRGGRAARVPRSALLRVGFT